MAKSKKTTKSTKVAKTQVEEPIEQPVKRKKKHRGLKVLIVLLTIFVVLPVAFFFGAIYDPSSKDNLPKNELAYQNLVSTMISDGMANVRKEKAMSMEFNEEMLDGVMLYACNLLNKKDYVPQMYCDIHDNNYDFYIELKASFLKTRVKIGTSLTKVDEGDPEKETLVFKVNELKIGRLPIPLNWITSITSNFITDQQIEEIFKKTGFNFKCSFADLQLTYTRKQFLIDVESLLVEYAGNNEYINIFLDAFGYNDILTTEFTDKVKVKFNLKPLSENKLYNKEHFFDFDGSDDDQRLENHAVAIEEWLNHGYFDEETATSVFTFLLRGNKSDATTKYKIDNLDDAFKDRLLIYLNEIQQGLTTDTITTGFKGSIINDNKEQFADYYDSEIAHIATSSPDLTAEKVTQWLADRSSPLNIIEMNEDHLNKFLASIEGAVGNVTLITSLNNNKWNADYVVLDNLYIDFDKYGATDYKMCMYFGLNINGFPTTIVIPTEIDFRKEDGQMSLYFNLDQNDDGSCAVFLGDIPLSKYTQDEILFKKMGDLVKENAFKFDIDNKRFEININDFIPSQLESVLESIKTYLACVSNNDALTFQLV